MKLVLTVALLFSAACFAGCTERSGGVVATPEEQQQNALSQSEQAEMQAQMEAAKRAAMEQAAEQAEGN